MADTLGETLEQAIPLAEMIEELRMQLQASMNAARGQDLRFAVKEVAVELQVAITRATEGSAGLKFWVLDASAGHKATEQMTHTFKLALEPVTGDAIDSQPRGTALVSSETTRKPM